MASAELAGAFCDLSAEDQVLALFVPLIISVW